MASCHPCTICAFTPSQTHVHARKDAQGQASRRKIGGKKKRWRVESKSGTVARTLQRSLIPHSPSHPAPRTLGMACHPFDMETDCQPASQPARQSTTCPTRERERARKIGRRAGRYPLCHRENLHLFGAFVHKWRTLISWWEEMQTILQLTVPARLSVIL